MPTTGSSIKPLKVKLLAGEQKATESWLVSDFLSGSRRQERGHLEVRKFVQIGGFGEPDNGQLPDCSGLVFHISLGCACRGSITQFYIQAHYQPPYDMVAFGVVGDA